MAAADGAALDDGIDEPVVAVGGSKKSVVPLNRAVWRYKTRTPRFRMAGTAVAGSSAA